MSKTNPQIGECPCPVTGCGKKCAVRKFQQRATSDTGRRKAGKLYMDCPDHGRFGFDGAGAMQDFILEHATIWGEERRPKSEPEPAAPAAESPALPAAPASTPKRSKFDLLNW